MDVQVTEVVDRPVGRAQEQGQATLRGANRRRHRRFGSDRRRLTPQISRISSTCGAGGKDGRMATSLDQVADELYALLPGQFTKARNDREKAAKGEGEKDIAAEIKALRKPSAAAWVVNMLARHRTKEIDQVLELGASLRSAQQDLDRDELRELTRQRQQLVAAVARDGAALAEQLGDSIGASALTEVEQTLQAGMADESAALAVRSGRLVRSLSSTGWDPVDLTDAVAGSLDGVSLPKSKPAKEKSEPIDLGAERELRSARKEAAETERARKDAERTLSTLERKVGSLTPRRNQLSEELEGLKERVAEMESRLEEVEAELKAVERDRDTSAEVAEAAEKVANKAAEKLAKLEK